MSVIYSIKNLVNNKVYIGSSKSHKRRKYAHFYSLKRGVHHSTHLQNSYNKYGKDNFAYYILEECDEDVRKIREVFYIEKYKSHLREFGYNIYEPDDNKFKCSEETKIKISNAHDERISVDLYKVTGEFIGTYVSLSDCARNIGTYGGMLSGILKGYRKSYKGYTIVKSGECFNYTPSSKQRNMKRFYK